MTAYLIKRLALAVPVLLLTAILVFSALHLAGGDPVMLLVPANAPQETRAAVRAKLGLGQRFCRQDREGQQGNEHEKRNDPGGKSFQSPHFDFSIEGLDDRYNVEPT